MPALAAQLRAFSSLLSLPSQAQSVIKAFRRQGIGSADVFNNARFFLSRLESLSAAPTSLSFLRFRSKSSKSSAGGQDWPLSRPMGETVCFVPFRYRCTPQIPQTRPDARFSVGVLVVLSVGLCQSRRDRLSPARTSVRPAPAAPLRACLLAVPAVFRKGRRPSRKTSSNAEVKDS